MPTLFLAFLRRLARPARLVGFALALQLLTAGVAPAFADLPAGENLFRAHCVGCHVNGGNILRRSKTLKLAALQRNGINNAAAVAVIAANGLGQMAGYGAVLGEGGADQVARYVWSQAEAGWPKAKSR